MAHVRYNSKQRVSIYDVRKSLYKSRRRKFHHKFSDTTCLSGDTISQLVKKARTHGILIDRKTLKGNSVLTEEKFGNNCRRLENSPRKSWRRLTLQSGVPVDRNLTAA
jgi:hypothetical protein